jgi:amidase
MISAMSLPSDLLNLYTETDAVGLAAHIRRGDLTLGEALDCAITVIERLDPSLNAVVHRLYDEGRAALPALDRSAPFAGVPYLSKELASMWRGAPYTNGSAWMRHVVAPADDLISERLRAAGFLMIGKTNSPEFGWSVATEPALYGPTRNPWSPAVGPGGSSGGSAAAVAARMVPIAEASDAAGSIRVPASCCGLVGLKPSRGRLSFHPAADPWLGTVFTLCVSRTVRDTAAYLDAVAGALPGELHALPTPERSWLASAALPPPRLRIGFSVTPIDGGPIDMEIAEAVRVTARLLESLGHDVDEHDLPIDGSRAWPLYARHAAVQNAAFIEALTPLVGAPPRERELEPVTWALLQRGRATNAVDYMGDLATLRDLGRRIVSDLLPYDVFLTPTLTQKPRPIGYLSMQEPDLDRYNARWADACFLYPFNISGQPAISLPLHWSEDGLPIGIQAVGRIGDEATLLALSAELETTLPWRARKPPIAG